MSWKFHLSTPAGTSVFGGGDGIIFIQIAVYRINGGAGYGQTSNDPVLIATESEVIVNPTGSDLVDLLFANQNPFVDGYSGQAITFLLSASSPAYVTAAGGSDGIGRIIDNRIDRSAPYSPMSYQTSGASYANVSNISSPSGPLVLGTVSSVPEPNGIFLAFMIASLGSWRRRRARASRPI